MSEIELLKKDNYLAVINNAAKGENWMFRNLYAEIDGAKKDIVENGALGCAIFVSSVLYLNKFISDVHATVLSTEKDLIKSGWFESKELKEGAVIIWEAKKFDSGMHSHIGFYVGNGEAVSNDSNGTGFIKKHRAEDGTRKIEKIYRHSLLD